MLNWATTQCCGDVDVNVSIEHGVIVRLKSLAAPKLVCFSSRWDMWFSGKGLLLGLTISSHSCLWRHERNFVYWGYWLWSAVWWHQVVLEFVTQQVNTYNVKTFGECIIVVSQNDILFLFQQDSLLFKISRQN